ncbi:MAG TPA: YMGG-like glycine zipper-containing protein [Rhodocyclaceae bacterium]|nr:glycine zipper 2TM domain-containing protein [Rhodocyclaceae bacterium]HMV53380.1 YMGG-like glycine zipper-containing protein [Rhodocyclaceae bacterium]HMZ83930.1 YMGG-like glycine zipper-containing protein [Rhodocyclaceae bacterium]HNA03559.1 YMGG-like glycine zipper-containing protein [Rhodocyclaceae bacterium]HNB77643.1 YMGG-like glycine zipper-containing protein [Rhodocyclaceae bacterium]
MLKKTFLIAGLGIAMIGAQPVFARDDTVIGALIGAGVGAAIGHNVGGERGAVLGGAIGAVTGASIGGANRGYTRTHYEEPGAYYTPQPAYVEVPAYPRRAPVLVERIDYPPVSYRDRDERRWNRHHHHRHDRCDEDRHDRRHGDAYRWR